MAMPIEASRRGLDFAQYVGGRLLTAAQKKAEEYSLIGDEHIATRLRRQSPLRKAQIGHLAIKRGKRLDNPELEFTGEALVVQAVVDAAEDPQVADEVVERVTDIALKAGIEPTLSPLVANEVAEQATELLPMQSTIDELFPHQNRQE
jgi:hypothetical protein